MKRINPLGHSFSWSRDLRQCSTECSRKRNTVCLTPGTSEILWEKWQGTFLLPGPYNIRLGRAYEIIPEYILIEAVLRAYSNAVQVHSS